MSDMPDLSSLFGMLNDKNIDINSLMQAMSNKNNSQSNNSTISSEMPNLNDILNNAPSTTNANNSNNSSNQDDKMPDMETMMKIMKLMNSMKSSNDSPSANLLYSLKPFLRDSKKEKVDQYVKFLKISTILTEINKSGGDLK